VCACSLNYPACKTHAPYYVVICGLFVSTMFFHINGTIFGEEITERNVCFEFLYNYFLNISHSKKIQRHIVTYLHKSSSKEPAILVIFYFNLIFLDIFSTNTPNTKFHENPSCGSRVIEAVLAEIHLFFYNPSKRPKPNNAA